MKSLNLKGKNKVGILANFHISTFSRIQSNGSVLVAMMVVVVVGEEAAGAYVVYG